MHFVCRVQRPERAHSSDERLTLHPWHELHGCGPRRMAGPAVCKGESTNTLGRPLAVDGPCPHRRSRHRRRLIQIKDRTALPHTMHLQALLRGENGGRACTVQQKRRRKTSLNYMPPTAVIGRPRFGGVFFLDLQRACADSAVPNRLALERVHCSNGIVERHILIGSPIKSMSNTRTRAIQNPALKMRMRVAPRAARKVRGCSSSRRFIENRYRITCPPALSDRLGRRVAAARQRKE